MAIEVDGEAPETAEIQISETETEFGKVTSFKAENLEGVSGAERRIVGMPWRRLTKELKLSLTK